ncbi:hypothetical protein PAPYR_5613 [Paratrimastix pyriformis]|uniref:Uncharacterized protein n=1 Tax=Paratrimastix pyriformis TaxID=342808 RepID=A0ABQ8UHF9_9EUKA|nr:hypothetical protein PAPYR_5613 [Paratrimastix pyriformis]
MMAEPGNLASSAPEPQTANEVIPEISHGLDEILGFVFPRGILRPRSWGALRVFSQFGNTLYDGFLHGGFKGKHALRDFEVRNLITEAEEADILAVFLPNWEKQVLSRTEKTSILQEAHDIALPNPTPHDVAENILGKVQRIDGKFPFAATQQAITTILNERLDALKRGRVNPKGGSRRPTGSTTMSATRAASGSAQQTRPSWDRSFGLAGTQRGSYVNTRNAPRQNLHGIE